MFVIRCLPNTTLANKEHQGECCASAVRFKSPVVLLVHQMVSSAERHQVSVVGWRGDGDGAGAAHIGVAQLVGEDLQLIRGEAVVVPQHIVVRGAARALSSKQVNKG